MPPVTATATGRLLVVLFFRRSRRLALGVPRARFLGRDGVRADALVDRLDLGRLRSSFAPLGEDLLGEPEIRRGLAARALALLDALEREGKAAALGIHLDDLRANGLALVDDLTRILDMVLRQLGDVHEPFDSRNDLDEGAEGDHLGHL